MGVLANPCPHSTLVELAPNSEKGEEISRIPHSTFGLIRALSLTRYIQSKSLFMLCEFGGSISDTWLNS